MQKRHFNRELYYEEQAYTTSRFVVPFIEEQKSLSEGITVLEIGCLPPTVGISKVWQEVSTYFSV